MTTTTPRATTKSPVAFTRAAREVARAAVATYSSARSRKDFTPHQHVALLALKVLLRTDYRGLVAQVAEWSDLREALGLTKVPHFTTLRKAHERLNKGAPTPS
ncbi:hypothetical protein J0H58_02025 [bacterium]|nr:hypothetical protein [bacterium]